MLEIDERSFRPETAAQLLAGEDAARSLEQRAQDFEWLLLKAHALCAVAQLAGLAIQLE